MLFRSRSFSSGSNETIGLPGDTVTRADDVSLGFWLATLVPVVVEPFGSGFAAWFCESLSETDDLELFRLGRSTRVSTKHHCRDATDRDQRDETRASIALRTRVGDIGISFETVGIVKPNAVRPSPTTSAAMRRALGFGQP